MLVLLAGLPRVHAASPEARNGDLVADARHVAPSAVMTSGWTNFFPALHTVSAVSSTDAWAAGEAGHLLHYTGVAWTAVDPPEMQGIVLSDLNMASASLGWV